MRSLAENGSYRSVANLTSHGGEAGELPHRRAANHEFSRLLSAAVVSSRFRQMLLLDPARALAEGYLGERFDFDAADHEIMLSIQASTLQEFVLEFTSHSQSRQQADPSKSSSQTSTSVVERVHHRNALVLDGRV